MRPRLLLCASVFLLVACTERDVDLRGTLGEGWPDEALFASVGGDFPPIPVENGAFTFSDVPAGPIDLRISAGGEEIARMGLRDIPGGAALSLERIRWDREHDFAFPATVSMDGADLVTINGIRRGNPDALPDQVDETGAVLAISDEADALILRPGSERLPDLPVVVTPATLVTDASGKEARLKQVSAGDSIRVEGRTGSGYVYASRIVLGGGPGGESAGAVAGGQGSAGEVSAVREQEPEWEGKHKKEKRGKKAKEDKGPKIPKGHRPPPGECRDWIPGLPPGQQPPPRKC